MKTSRIIQILLLGVIITLDSNVNAVGKRGSMFIENNEYQNMLIAISENVKEDEDLVTRIKEVFTEASQFLYQATRYQ